MLVPQALRKAIRVQVIRQKLFCSLIDLPVRTYFLVFFVLAFKINIPIKSMEHQGEANSNAKTGDASQQ